MQRQWVSKSVGWSVRAARRPAEKEEKEEEEEEQANGAKQKGPRMRQLLKLIVTLGQ